MGIRHALIIAVGALCACGDPAFEPTATISNNGPAGTTTSMGTVSALVDGEPFVGKLPDRRDLPEWSIRLRRVQLRLGTPGRWRCLFARRAPERWKPVA